MHPEDDVEIEDVTPNADGSKIVITVSSITKQKISLDDFYFALEAYVKQLERASRQLKSGRPSH